MRGLILFITDLRKCKGKEEEIKRINKELANIRSKFKGDKPLNGYHKKKYVCKLLFMFLLGHNCDFGYMEAVNLLSSNAYSEKQIGYLFISVVMTENHNFIPLMINSLKNDLTSDNKIFQNLSLQFIANSSNKYVADAVADQALELLLSNESADFVKQTAALTLLQVLRIKPDLIFDECKTNRMINLISHHNLGVVTASASLIEFLAKKTHSQYESCITHCIGRLSRFVNSAYIDFQDYTYYSVAAPWLSVKLLRLLQNFPAPTDVCVKSRLRESLEMILNKAQESTKSKKFEHCNAKFAVIFEAISLIIQMDLDAALLFKAISILGSALNYKEANVRFMALDMMAQLTEKEVCLGNIRMHWEAVLDALRTEIDITIKKRAIDLLYNICDKNNVKPVVEEMLYYIETQADSSQDTILKISALTEKFSTDLHWYVDTVLIMLDVCGDNVNDGVWFTLVKVITDNDNIQKYAARAAFAVLHNNPCNDTVVKTAGYILGEFGYLIAKEEHSSGEMQLSILREKFLSCSHSTRALLLTTYLKFLNMYPHLKDQIQSILKDKVISRCENVEIQQRAVEYLKLSEMESPTLLATVLEEMPSFHSQKSAVVKAIEKRKSQTFKPEYFNKAPTQNKPFHSTLNLCDIPKYTSEAHIQATRSISHSNLHEASASTNLNLLMEVFKDTPHSVNNNNSYAPLNPTCRISNYPANENYLHNLLFNEKGVLFEDDVIRVLIQCEFKRHFGRFHLTYQNRSLSVLTELRVNGCFANTENKYSVWFKPNHSILDFQGSMQQDIHLECLNGFSTRPSLIMRFICDKDLREMKILLPLTVNKFSEPVSMSSLDFEKKWENLRNFRQDAVKEFAAKYPMIHSVTRLKLSGFRVSVVASMDSNPQAFKCAGLFYTRTLRTGFLIKLVGFPEANRYKSTVRSSQASLSQNISNLLFELL